MKGGRTAPRNARHGHGRPTRRAGFNEGGADCPPKPEGRSACAAPCAAASMKGGRTAPRNTKMAKKAETSMTSFNEGGADCPPKLRVKVLNRAAPGKLQ